MVALDPRFAGCPPLLAKHAFQINLHRLRPRLVRVAVRPSAGPSSRPRHHPLLFRRPCTRKPHKCFEDSTSNGYRRKTKGRYFVLVLFFCGCWLHFKGLNQSYGLHKDDGASATGQPRSNLGEGAGLVRESRKVNNRRGVASKTGLVGTSSVFLSSMGLLHRPGQERGESLKLGRDFPCRTCGMPSANLRGASFVPPCGADTVDP